MPVLEKDATIPTTSSNGWVAFLKKQVSKKPIETSAAKQLSFPLKDHTADYPGFLTAYPQFHWEDEELTMHRLHTTGLNRVAHRNYRRKPRHNWSVQLSLVWDVVFEPMVQAISGSGTDTVDSENDRL
jgi:hypothetical protein